MVALTQDRPRVALPGKGAQAGIVLGLWVVLWALLKGTATLTLAAQDTNGLHRSINDLNDAVGRGRNSNPLFLYVFNEIRLVIDKLVTGIQYLISQPSDSRPVPAIGWLGVVALAMLVAFVFSGLRISLLTGAGFVFFGLQGLWEESMDTLALTLAAVLVSLAVGIPLGIWAGLSDRFLKGVTPLLDFMQTMPTFVYLAPLTLFFLIGPASATIATLIYAAPPAIRITSHAIRTVPRSTMEASESLGTTRTQSLVSVLLPMARRTIVLGVNQTIMAALSMATIAALIDAPGLGKTVLKALETLDVGTAFNAGLAIVIMAIVLDRATTAASDRVERKGRTVQPSGLLAKVPVLASLDVLLRAHRRVVLVASAVVALALVYLSRTYLWAAEFPDGLSLKAKIINGADSASGWVQDTFSPVTLAFKNLVTTLLLNPFQALLVESPWFVVAAVGVSLAWIFGGRVAALTAALCLALIIATGLWGDAMTTLASTLVATVLVMILGLVVGAWMGRSDRADGIIRPVLDAAQVMPAFVYLVPILALFDATRFTAIVAAVIFAAPVSIKVVADGVRAVSTTTMEAATSVGTTGWQTITKVQLPMARASLTLAMNQGLIYVLSMIVVGGLVGAGALGYLVVAGFSQGELYGKGLAAGLAIVLLGIMLDRVTQATAQRAGRHPGGGH